MPRPRPPANTGPAQGRVLPPPPPRPQSLPRLGCSQPGQPAGLSGSGWRLPGWLRFRTTGLQGGRSGRRTAPRSRHARCQPTGGHSRRPSARSLGMSVGPSHGLTNPNASPENGLLDVAGVPPTPLPPPQHGHGFGQPPALGLTPTCSEPSFPTAGFTSPRLALRPRPAVTARCSQRLRPRPPRPPQHGPHRDRPNFSPILAETAGVATAQCSLRPAGHSRAPGLGSSFPSRGAEAEARGGGINRLQAAARGRQSRASRHSGRSSAGSS